MRVRNTFEWILALKDWNDYFQYRKTSGSGSIGKDESSIKQPSPMLTHSLIPNTYFQKLTQSVKTMWQIEPTRMAEMSHLYSSSTSYLWLWV